MPQMMGQYMYNYNMDFQPVYFNTPHRQDSISSSNSNNNNNSFTFFQHCHF